MTPFDYPTWAAQGRANADKLPTGVAEALGPERDWADELWFAASEAWNNVYLVTEKDAAAAEVIRSRCRPISNDTVTDEWLKAAMYRLASAKLGDTETLRAIIAEATQ